MDEHPPAVRRSLRALASAILSAGSVIVPKWRRRDWRREWESELWYERREPLRRSVGAVPHAARLRVQHWSLDLLAQDLRDGARMLRRSPGFTLVAAITLALGIGATTAIFSIVHTVLWRPLPYSDPGRLVQLWETNPDRDWTDAECAPANVADWRRDNRSFEQMAAYFGAAREPWISSYALTGAGDPERVKGLRVTTNFFDVLGVQPAIGRAFLPQEEFHGDDAIAILGAGLWRRRFGADPSIVGRTIALDGVARTVVGVLPDGFTFGNSPIDLWLPMGWTPASVAETRRPHYLRVIARLKAGTTVAQAQADLSAIASGLARQYPETNTHMGVGVGPLQDWIVGPSRAGLLLFLGAVALVLLVACANVANLMSARGSTRDREIAVRSALGASSTRLLRQMLTESVLLAAIGGGLGLLVAYATVSGVVRYGPPTLPRIHEIEVDRVALAFTAFVTMATGIAFGLVPARQSRTKDVARVVRGAGQAGPSGGSRLRSVLVVAELALSLALLVGAMLLVRSFVKLDRVDLGFAPDGAVAVPITLSRTTYRDRATQRAFVDRLLERVRVLPGVTAAGVAERGLLDGQLWTSDFTVEHRPPDEFGIQIRHNELSPGYLQAIGARIVSGRDFTDRDRPPAPTTVLVNEALVRKYFHGQDPIGQRLNFDRPGGTSPWRTIVGVVGDYREELVDIEARPTIYEPIAQNTDLMFTLVMRTPTPAAALVPGVRAILRDLDPGLPVPAVHPLAAQVTEAMAPRRFSASLMGLFAAAALLLAAVGLYGVLAYLAEQRTHEIGVRMALGASGADVVRLVARQAAVLVATGLAVGVVLALAAGRAIRGLLFGVQPTDPATFVAVALILASAAAIAVAIPVRRALRISPLTALRAE